MSLIISGTTSTAGITLASANNPVFIPVGSYVFGTTATGLYGGTAAAWTVSNAGQVRSVSFGISVKSGGIVTNKAVGAITGGTDGIYAAGSSSVALTVSNAGYIAGANTINGYGIKENKGALVVSNLYGGTILGGYGGIYIPSGGGVGTITNNGSVVGLKFGGVVFNGGGGISNQSSRAIVGQEGVAINTTAGTVSNAGLIHGKLFQGIILGNGGTVANLGSGTIAGLQNGVQVATASGSVTNAGSITGGTGTGLVLSAGGTLNNQISANLVGGGNGIYVSAGGFSATNAGYIGGFNTLSPSAGYGIKVKAGATSIVNLTSGTIVSANIGIYIPVGGGAGTLANQGIIQSSNANAVIFDAGGTIANLATGTITGRSGVAVFNQAGTLNNAGSIVAKVVSAVVLGAGGTIANQAGASIAGAQTGVQMGGTAGTLLNAGSIAGTSKYGIYLNAGGTVTNLGSGTISGTKGIFVSGGATTIVNAGSISGASTAVAMAAGVTNRVIVDAGGGFSGTVNGGNTVGATAVSTLELAVGATALGHLSGIGSQFVNFAQVTVDSAAYWTLNGTNTLASGTTLTNSGKLFVANGALTDAGAIVNNGQIVDNATVTLGALSGTGQVLIGTNSMLTTTGTVASTQTIAFTGGGGLLDLTPSSFSGIIQGFESGDAIELANLLASPTSAGIVNGNTLSVSLTSGGPINLVLEPDQIYNNLIFSVRNPGTAFGNNWFISVAGASGPTIVDGGGSAGFTGAQASTLAASNGGLGGIVVTGNNSVLTTTGSFAVGDTSVGLLDIQVGGTVLSTVGATIANGAGASGTAVDVAGIGSNWQVGGLLNIGNAATGILSITDGATVNAAALDSGILANSAGVITVSGSNAALTTAGFLSVGEAGAGVLSVLNGANVIIGGDFNIGQGVGGSGNVNIQDGTGTVSVGANLNIGMNGAPAVLTVGPTSTLMVDNGGINAGANAVLNLFTAIDPIFLAGGTSNISSSSTNAITQIYTAYVSAATFNIAQGSSGMAYTLETPTILGAAKFNLGGSGDTLPVSLILNSGSVSSGTTITFNNAIDTLVIGIDNLATIDTPASGTGPFTAIANPTLNAPLIAGFQGTIAGFVAGDTIDVDTNGTATFTLSGSIVSVIQNGTTTGTLAFATATMAQNALGSVIDVPLSLCFLAGTLIRTPTGEVEVEKLVAGDTVLTASGKVRPIAWIGQGKVLATRGRRTAATPVIVRKGALGPNVPHADLRVTKGHSLFVDDVLVPVEFLVNHRSILWDDRAQEVSIYHVELDAHDVLLANGAPAESYRDDGNRWLFQNANSGWDMPPKEPCAPVLTGGPVVDAVWRRLLDACGPRPGLPQTDDPDLHLLADGVRVDGIRTGDNVSFSLRSVPAELRIVSRSGCPAELGLARDPRELGVAIRRIGLFKGHRAIMVEAEDPRLADGFHAFEPELGHRWTSGDALLPPALFDGIDGRVDVQLTLGGTTRYWDEGMPAGRVAA